MDSNQSGLEQRDPQVLRAFAEELRSAPRGIFEDTARYAAMADQAESLASFLEEKRESSGLESREAERTGF